MFNFETGWIGRISEDFTFANVRRAATEIADRLQTGAIIVGYDSRFLAERFAEETVKVMEGKGIGCYLVERDTPTPVVAWEVEDKGVAGAVMITAGSKSSDYCGIQFIKGKGALRQSSGQARGKGQGVERFEPRERYLKHIAGQVDEAIIRRAKLKIVIDPMYGSGRGYLDKLLQGMGCRVEEIHNYREVLFGGMDPDPIEKNLHELKAKMKEFGADLGIALNGDASSFAAVARGGKYCRGEGAKDALLEGLLLVERTARGIIHHKGAD